MHGGTEWDEGGTNECGKEGRVEGRKEREEVKERKGGRGRRKGRRRGSLCIMWEGRREGGVQGHRGHTVFGPY